MGARSLVSRKKSEAQSTPMQRSSRKISKCSDESSSSQCGGMRKRMNRMWCDEEDKLLEYYYHTCKGNWKKVSENLAGRNASQCSQRWKRLNPERVWILHSTRRSSSGSSGRTTRTRRSSGWWPSTAATGRRSRRSCRAGRASRSARGSSTTSTPPSTTPPSPRRRISKYSTSSSSSAPSGVSSPRRSKAGPYQSHSLIY